MVSGRLKGLSKRTEGEFLSVGGSLRATHATAGKISELASSVTASMSGEEIRAAIDGLRTIVESVNEFLGRAGEETTRDEKSLNDIRKILAVLRSPLKDFAKVVKFLRNLGVATKIESARMGQDSGGFGVVAENVEKLSSLFEAKSADITKRSGALQEEIVRALSQVIEHRHALREKTHSILDEAQSDLAALVQTHDKCAATGRTVLECSTEISRDVGEVVASMQFHDITRQQVEHVTEAIDELAEKLEASGDGPELVDLTRDICMLQVAHLENSQESLVKAVANVVDHLQRIAATASGVAHKTREMSGSVGHAGQNVLSLVGQGLTSVGSAVAESAAAVREFSGVIHSIARTVEEMSSFVADIEEIGAEIELVALNAEIKAAHTGSKGAALGVLAESIQRLSVDSRSQRTAVSEALANIQLFAVAMRDASGTNDAGGSAESDVDGLRSSLSRLLDSLGRINGGIVNPLSELDECARTLSEGIDRIVQEMSAHHVVSEVIGAAVSELGKIVAECKALNVSDGTAATRPDLRSLADRYTMHAERDIHSVVLGTGTAAVATSPGGGGDFGANVEIF